MPEAWETDPGLATLKQEAARLIESMAGEAPWGWQDPRNCFTFPFWRSLLPELRLLICLRHPAEVARSLAAARASSDAFGWYLWEEYARALAAPAEQSLTTHNQALLADPLAELDSVARFCGLEPGRALLESVVGEALLPSPEVELQPKDLPDRVQVLYRNLLNASGRKWPGEYSKPVVVAREPEPAAMLALLRERDDAVHRLAEKERILQEVYASKGYGLVRLACRNYDRAVLVGIRVARRLRFPRIWIGKRAALPSGPLLPPPKTYDIFCLPIIDWEFRYQRPQQLLSRFASSGHRVFYLRTGFHGAGEDVEVEEIQPGVHGVRLPGPIRLNLYRHRPDSATVARWSRALERFRLRENMRGGVCLVHLPFWAPLAWEGRKRFGWHVVYDCMDEHAGFSTTGRTMLELETELFRSQRPDCNHRGRTH